eukprot:318355_1
MAIRILTKLIEYFEWDIEEDMKNNEPIDVPFEDLNDMEKAFWFCHRNQLTEFRDIASKIVNFNPNTKDKNKHSLLHIVSCHGYIKFLEYLLSEYSTIIDINIVDRYNHNAAHWASLSGHVNCLNLLIKHGINILNNKSLSKDGFFVVVRQIPVYSFGGKSCLHFAAEYGNIDCIKVLINYLKQQHNMDAMDMNYMINLKDFNGHSALDLAILNKEMKCAEILAKYVNDDNFMGVNINHSLNSQCVFKQFVYNYYKTQERIAQNFKDTLPGMHGNCCDTCREMYHIADGKIHT